MIKTTTHTVLEPSDSIRENAAYTLRPRIRYALRSYFGNEAHRALLSPCVVLYQTVISRVKLNKRLRRHHHVFCSTQPLYLVLQTIFHNQFLHLPPAFASTESFLQVLHFRCHFKLTFHNQRLHLSCIPSANYFLPWYC